MSMSHGKMEKLYGITLLLTAAVVLGALTGCVTAVQCPPQPDWISSPEADGYYVGVGSASSGNPAEDRPVAESRARADLAARISVQISGEMAVETESSSAGNYEQRVQELVKQSVEKNLQDIETVDTYFCPDMGTWVYVRLSRAQWQKIQEQRRAEVLKRVQDLLDPVLADRNSPLVTRFERLSRSYELIAESSLGEKVMGSIAGQSGNISDIVKSSLNAHMGGMQILLDSPSYSVEVGAPFRADGRLSSSMTGSIGAMQVRAETRDGRIVATTQTDPDGRFAMQLPEGFPSAGEMDLVVKPVPVLTDSFPQNTIQAGIPEAELVILIEKVTAGLVVDMRTNQSSRTIADEMKALFSDQDLPFRFVASRQESGYNLVVSVSVEDYPRVIENAPLMSKSWAVISLEKEGKSVYSYESQSVKDGGITIEQAHSRVLSKLIQEMGRDERLFSSLKSALSEN